MTDRTYITGDNIEMFCKVQNAAGFAERGEIILAWDDLDGSQKKLAKNIDIEDIQVRTTDPRSVPKKWSDKIVEEDADPDAVDFIKQVIANPARQEVYQLLKDYDPPEPLMLWWIDKTFTDDEYFKLLAEACRFGLFRTDNKYLWAVVAFGVDVGVGSFRWPESEKEPAEKKSIKKKLVDEYGVRPKEVDELWDELEGWKGWHATEIELSEAEADFLGVQRTSGGSKSDDQSEPGDGAGDSPGNADDDGGATSLLDF